MYSRKHSIGIHRKVNTNKFLILPNKDTGSCFSFMYLINGTQNSLHVTLINLGTDNKESDIWTARQSTDNKWKRASIFINTTIDIDVGFIGQTSHCIIAVDNVTYTTGKCEMLYSNLDQINVYVTGSHLSIEQDTFH